jgi:hypothetical protein
VAHALRWLLLLLLLLFTCDHSIALKLPLSPISLLGYNPLCIALAAAAAAVHLQVLL